VARLLYAFCVPERLHKTHGLKLERNTETLWKCINLKNNCMASPSERETTAYAKKFQAPGS